MYDWKVRLSVCMLRMRFFERGGEEGKEERREKGRLYGNGEDSFLALVLFGG